MKYNIGSEADLADAVQARQRNASNGYMNGCNVQLESRPRLGFKAGWLEMRRHF
jgi:hypothetical protein